MHRRAFNYRVRPCKIYVFKHAERHRRGIAHIFIERSPFLSAIIISPGSTSLTIPPDGIQRAGLRSKHIPGVEFPYAERAEAVYIAHGDKLIPGGYHERIRALEPLDRGHHRIGERRLFYPFLRYDI